ncbi:hypothetical protein FVR03_17800 [Pontibacter qinzhouensis]|uniref:Uncharacterized protein n=1 Tax=Pontibacter qinzhouensis TaxID=2603253 RepID=A0A5C8JID0_9BACT|nr:hypothetical protein [Pontibacter qinzhouensis]TXK36464.1 hypothetical protein FVR03_17800 [Pontibacter qinzhouensis]
MKTFYILSIMLAFTLSAFSQGKLTLSHTDLADESKIPLRVPKEPINSANTGEFLVKVANADTPDKKSKAKNFKFKNTRNNQVILVDANQISESGDTVLFKISGVNALFDPDENYPPDTVLTIALTEGDAAGKKLAQIILYKPQAAQTAKAAATPTHEEYLNKIKEAYPEFKENELLRLDHTVYLFITEDFKKVPGTVFPDCNANTDIYLVHYLTTKKEIKNLAFSGRENRIGSDLVILNSLLTAHSGGGPEIYIFPSSPIGPFDLGIDIKIEVDGKPAKTFTIPSCSLPYHVSIMGGFFASWLSNPENIVQSAPDATLFADNATSQKAITLMAVFYPVPRDRFYSYRNLKFKEKFSFSFGTKISEDIFDDLFLGLNYEFAKAGNFTGGVHYGQHTVIQGHDKFRFGKDQFAGTFSNNNTNQQYDFGFFIGLSIDLRVIGAIWNNSREQYRQNVTPE